MYSLNTVHLEMKIIFTSQVSISKKAKLLMYDLLSKH